MGQFKNIEFEIMAMAHDYGDDYGEDEQTVIDIAGELGLDPEQVREVLHSDADFAVTDLDVGDTEMVDLLDL